MENKTKRDFSAEQFVDNLLNEGATIACDETVESFRTTQTATLPPFYNEKLYEKGKVFFHDNIFALFLGKLLGLLVVLAVPSIIKILMFTKMSGTNLTAYRRYLSTLFHMCVWYQSDFKPGSRLWQSIADVKNRHNSASKKSCSAGLHRINQKDMALTQFGFMGFALTRAKMIGLHHSTNEELQGFVHIWRVVGYLMGMEDRYNICRESVEETREICQALIDRVFREAVEQKNKDFMKMSSYLVNGMWCMGPYLNHNIILNHLYNLLKQSSNNNNNSSSVYYLKMSWIEQIFMQIVLFTLYTMKFKLIRLYHNNIHYLALWLMKVCPFLAYYKFGKENSHVHILNDYKQE